MSSVVSDHEIRLSSNVSVELELKQIYFVTEDISVYANSTIWKVWE